MSQLKNAKCANMNQLSYKTFNILNYVQYIKDCSVLSKKKKKKKKKERKIIVWQLKIDWLMVMEDIEL